MPQKTSNSKQESSNPIKFSKIKEWTYRYGPAEVLGTFAAYASFFIAQGATNNIVIASYAGAVGENIGFYGTMIIRELINDSLAAKKQGRQHEISGTVKTTGKLVTEFGFAEALDSLVVRPATMGFGSKILGSGFGVGAGKLLADIIFYIPTIISYEVRKKII